MKNKGIFSIEALMSFALLLIIITAIPLNEKPSTKNIIAKHKLSDLLIVSAYTNANEEEMRKDAELFFGKENFNETISGEIKVYKNKVLKASFGKG